MTKVDFYILQDDSIEQRHLFACRLVEKAYRLGHHIYLHSDDDAQANALDQLMWSWNSSSFVPHSLEQSSTSSPSSQYYKHGSVPVQIGHNSATGSAAHHNDLLINLSQSVPECFSRFERVAEIVVQIPAITETTRLNYRFYRDRGYPLNTHDLRK